jgi:hypothetical protein
MSKLRRHDWRNHRVVECNICGETLMSRQEIGSHGQIEHQLYRIASCKFFPDCIDDDESMKTRMIRLNQSETVIFVQKE